MSSYVPILQRERNPRLREDKGGSQDFKSGLFDSDAKGPEPWSFPRMHIIMVFVHWELFIAPSSLFDKQLIIHLTCHMKVCVYNYLCEKRRTC